MLSRTGARLFTGGRARARGNRNAETAHFGLLARPTASVCSPRVLCSFVLTDPVYLAEPLMGELRWLYRPNVDFELIPFDPEATRSFLSS
jgi:hypothetical protein